jgi:uncharacterized protein YecE (DUF72 family)
VTLYVGTSGWQYDDWASRFYPDGLAKSRWLEWYSDRFATVESNNAFYRLPERSLFARWAARTPDDFVMAVKASRFLTHVRRLREPHQPVERLLRSIDGLGSKLGPILLQLPPNMTVSVELLSVALDQFPRSIRVAVEVRHPSWYSDDIRRALESHDAAMCLVDRANHRSPVWRTASWGYVRFHEGTASPRPCYGRSALSSWAERIESLWSRGDDVYCYFNNDTNACAPRDAHAFALAARRKGLDPARTGASEPKRSGVSEPTRSGVSESAGKRGR